MTMATMIMRRAQRSQIQALVRLRMMSSVGSTMMRTLDGPNNNNNTNNNIGNNNTTAIFRSRHIHSMMLPRDEEEEQNQQQASTKHKSSSSHLPQPQQFSTNCSSSSRMNNRNQQSSYFSDIRINSTNKQSGIRSYHTTKRRDILPLLGFGIVVGGYYSYRALERMNAEQADYNEAMKEYRLAHGLSEDEELPTTANSTNNGTAAASSLLFRGGTVAIDLGTRNIRVGHMPSSSSSSLSSNPKPIVVVNREGARSTPNCILFDDNDDGTSLVGTMALGKLYDRGGTSNPVLHPSILLSGGGGPTNDDNNNSNRAIRYVVTSAARNALDQILGSSSSSTNAASDTTLFSIDTNFSNGFNAQPIFTYPPPPTSTSNSKINDDDDEPTSSTYLTNYQNAVADLSSPSSIARFIPEPICAIAGARFHKLLPSQATNGPIMVIDVGGNDTSLSIVNQNTNNILHHSRLNGLGGETMVQALMDHLSQSFYGTKSSEVNDGMGLQRLYDASRVAVMEMSGGSGRGGGGSGTRRVEVNIPYLSVDEKMQPKHLEEGVSSQVLESEFNLLIRSTIIPSYTNNTNDDDDDTTIPILSQAMPTPKDLPSLLSSAILQALEQAGTNPFALEKVLVVGGGARNPTFRWGIKGALGSLAGEAFTEEKLVVPKEELVEELVVLGAAVLGSDSSTSSL